MSKIEDLAITGRSGAKYTFSIYRYGQGFRPVGAVYVVLQRQVRADSSVFYRFIYVGETGDLSTRFSSHHKQDCFRTEGCTHVGIHVDSSQRSRLDKEDDILKGNRWPCND